MARRPRTVVAVATAHQGGRSRRSLRHQLRSAVALNGGFLLRPLGVLWRALPYLRSRNAKSAAAAAAMARRHWRDDAPPRETLILRLRRAVARAGGVISAAILSGRRTLAVLHRAFAVLHRAPSPRRARVVVRAWLRRLLRAWRSSQVAPPPPPPPPRNAGACMYGRLARRPPPPPDGPPAPPPPAAAGPPAPPPPPVGPPAPPGPRIHEVDGEVVPQGVVNMYRDYCTRQCPPNYTICHLCEFEMERARNFAVLTYMMAYHCDRHDPDVRLPLPHVRCYEPGCSVRTRPGRDQALHIYFCHQLPPAWWNE